MSTIRRDPRQRLVGERGRGELLQGQHLTVVPRPGPALQSALLRMCWRLSAGVSPSLLWCQSVCPPACAGSSVRPRGESPCLSTSKEGGSRCHCFFFPGCCKEVAIVFFLSLYLNSRRLQVKLPFTLCSSTVPMGTLVSGGTRRST